MSVPPPTPPVFLTAEWRHLVMLNYRVDPALLESRVPAGTELDRFDGRTFISVVGFRFLGTRLLGIPVPFHRNFEEINLRFYVRRKDGNQWRRGVVFIKEIVPRRAIAAVARWRYQENYVARPTRSTIRAPNDALGQHGTVQFAWRGGDRWHTILVTFDGEPAYPPAGSEPEFIAEHYWGYSAQRDGTTLEYRVAHPPWRLWRVVEARFDCDVHNVYGAEFEAALGGAPSSAFLAEGSAVAVHRAQRLRAHPRTA